MSRPRGRVIERVKQKADQDHQKMTDGRRCRRWLILVLPDASSSSWERWSRKLLFLLHASQQ